MSCRQRLPVELAAFGKPKSTPEIHLVEKFFRSPGVLRALPGVSMRLRPGLRLEPSSEETRVSSLLAEVCGSDNGFVRTGNGSVSQTQRVGVQAKYKGLNS